MKENVLEIKERLRKYLDSERVTADKIERMCGCGAGSVHRFCARTALFRSRIYKNWVRDVPIST